MSGESGTTSLIDTASSGVAGLAGAVTSALGQAGPAGALAQPVVDALRNVWEGYFGAPIPPGGTNWNAYTHQQLYDMVWQHADVADVGAVADGWGRHSTELTGQAGALRDQQSALRSNWHGAAAEPAVQRLGQLGDRTQGISDRARTVQQATAHAGDALSVAQNTMPAPVDPIGSVITGALAGAVAGAGIGGAIGGVLSAGAGGVGAGPGAVLGAAVGAVAGGAASLFLASAVAAEKKAEAVHVMTRYETSLRQSSGAIAPTPAGATTAGTFGLDGPTTSTSGFVGAPGTGGFGGGGGVPWRQLVGGASGAEGTLGLGARSGALDSAALAGAGLLSGELAATEPAGGMGMMPPSARRGRGDKDEEHRNRMPSVDHGLFDVDERASTPVIGL